jgi:trehalose utilization protein
VSHCGKQENTAATILTDITGITDDEVGRIFEVVGGGVNFPTLINPTVKFILRNGVQWVGTQGSKTTFQIVKTGASQYAFFEIKRS